MSDLHEALDNERTKRLEDRIASNHDEVLLLLKVQSKDITYIKEQVTKTNGRVTKLENETHFVRVASRYPKLTMLSVVGGLALIAVLGLGTIFKIF